MTSRAGQRRRTRAVSRRAFTLLETVLALALIVLLVSVAFFGQVGWRGRQEFEEGVCRFEAVLRMAKADAARHGTRLRLAFDQEELTPQIQWEPQPLEEPGLFSEYTANTWADDVPVSLLRVYRCELVGPSAYRTLVMATARDPEELEAITFYPDGSCDSALIELAPMDEDDPVRAVIELDGLNGTITCRIMTSLELEEYYEQLEEGEYLGRIGG